VLKLWAQILKTVPRSRLVLKNKPFACDTARAHVLTLLAAEGIESWRVDLLPLAASNAEHLATYSLMDISLDPFPYAGTTTTCESLYMGVPCLTLAGHCHAHNVGLSLLTAVGLAQSMYIKA
ncbi:O-linked N-acetylglucosamine transferase, partial [Haematococcus lacustris]